MELKDQLIRHEGLRLEPYRCPAGKLTIGVGRNLEDRGLSREEALMLLDNDIEYFSVELAKVHPEINELDQVRYDVLVNMAFNMGVANLSRFVNMWAAINRRDYNVAADEMLKSRWATQVGMRSVELSMAMRHGAWV